MKYQIMIKMLMLLLSKRKVNAREIAERYEISVRSVYRYIEELIVAGVPVNVTRGRYGGISIADTFRLPTGYFTKGEYSAAINALTAMASQLNDENIAGALEKLQAQHKSESRDISVCGNVIIDGGTWGDTKKFADKMAVCEKAVNENLCIKIDYISRDGEHSRRVIDPHVLIFKQNVWYVYAFCHTKQDFRTFKIGRIKSASFTGKNFVKKEINRDDIPLNFYYRSEDMIDVGIEISKESLPDVEEWVGIDNIEPRGLSWIAEISLPDDNILVSKLLSFGGGVKVLYPTELKERVKKAAERVISEM